MVNSTLYIWQLTSQILSGIGSRALRYLLRRTAADDISAAVSPLGPKSMI